MDRAFSNAQLEQFKRDAKKLKKQRLLSMHEALDEVARGFGFQRWHQLVAARKARVDRSSEALGIGSAGTSCDDLHPVRSSVGHDAGTSLCAHYLSQKAEKGRLLDASLAQCSWTPGPLRPRAGCLYCRPCGLFVRTEHFFDNISHIAMDEAHLMQFYMALQSVVEPRLESTRLQAMHALGRFWEGLKSVDARSEDADDS